MWIYERYRNKECNFSLKLQKDIYLCFVDFTYAFDKVKYKQPLDILQDLDIDRNDIQLLRNLYYEQTAGMKIEDRISNYKEIKR